MYPFPCPSQWYTGLIKSAGGSESSSSCIMFCFAKNSDNHEKHGVLIDYTNPILESTHKSPNEACSLRVKQVLRKKQADFFLIFLYDTQVPVVLFGSLSPNRSNELQFCDTMGHVWILDLMRCMRINEVIYRRAQTEGARFDGPFPSVQGERPIAKWKSYSVGYWLEGLTLKGLTLVQEWLADLLVLHCRSTIASVVLLQYPVKEFLKSLSFVSTHPTRDYGSTFVWLPYRRPHCLRSWLLHLFSISKITPVLGLSFKTLRPKMAGFYRCNFHYNERGLRVESNIPQDNLFFLSHFKSDGATIQISERTELSNAAVKEMSSSLTFETFGTPCDTFCLPAVPRLIAVFSDLVCSDFEAKGIESSVLKVDMPWSLNSMREVLQGLHCRSEKNSARVLRLDILGEIFFPE
ncbi:hypothetical protein FGB62_192g01 [Gracilaria domingensis]|nr:hypothetical protein FGB62_455g00 [Gracilaria domingensis]KAI0556877.1 hypothetical protein FGB62_382g05 [Gracilaria domingensis]KAI0558702.1 hypothetical protein FGB62_192g01 [Gracilaria domingensis]